MNTLKVRCLLSQRYSIHFLDQVQQITRPIFATPCSYNNTVMRAPLRDKIQNAINKAINHDCNNNYNSYFGEGALIVGGRRRSRKKKNKKNASKKKKSPSLDSIKNKLSPASCRKGKDSDSAPLINEGNSDNKENMPLFGRKKKADAPAVNAEPAVMENGGLDAKDEAVEKTEEKEDKEEPNENDGSGVTMEKTEVDGNVAVTFTSGVTNDPKEEVKEEEVKEEEVQPVAAETNQSAPVKTEKSPLIGQTEPADLNIKDSKIRDHSPGFLCCTVL